MNAPLESRIATVLSDDKISSLDVADLLNENEMAIAMADNDATVAETTALDPLQSPDLHKARATVEDAKFRATRLRSLLPRLQTKYDKVSRNERHAKWASEYDRVKIKRDNAAEKLHQLYPQMAAKLVELLTDIEATDKEVIQINNAGTPFLTDGYPDDPRHRQLLSVELMARGLDHFGVYDLKIMTDLKMPNWTEPKKLAWPVPKPPVDWSGVVPKFPSKGADWASKREQGAA
jgi:hypothetical protein